MNSGIWQRTWSIGKVMIAVSIGDELWYTTAKDGAVHYHWISLGSTIDNDGTELKLYNLILPFVAIHIGRVS